MNCFWNDIDMLSIQSFSVAESWCCILDLFECTLSFEECLLLSPESENSNSVSCCWYSSSMDWYDTLELSPSSEFDAEFSSSLKSVHKKLVMRTILVIWGNYNQPEESKNLMFDIK